jgi:hypothetical protein
VSLEFQYSGYAGVIRMPINGLGGHAVNVAKGATKCVVRILLDIWFWIVMRAADVDHKGCCPRIVDIDNNGEGREAESVILLSDKSCGIFKC